MTEATEHFDVLIVGAGLSGIGAAYHLQSKCPGKSFASSRAATASAAPGTCFAIRACARTPTCTRSAIRFSRGRGRRRSPTAPSILNYVRETAREHGIDEQIRFGHRVSARRGRRRSARWTVEVERSGEARDELVRFTCNFLFMCSGYYSYEEGYTPAFAGASDFGGRIVHPQHWPEDLDYAGKRIVVIGSGATAVTLVPALAEVGGARHHAPALADLRRVAPGEDRRRQRAAPLLPTRLAYTARAGSNVLWGCSSSSSAGASRRGQASCCSTACAHGARARLRRRAPISRRATIPGTSGCAWCPTAICSRRSASGAPRS